MIRFIREYRFVLGFALTILIGIFVAKSFFLRESYSPRQEFGRQLFATPIEVSPLATQFSIRFNREDPFVKKVMVVSGRPVEVESRWPPTESDKDAQVVEMVFVPVRLFSDAPKGSKAQQQFSVGLGYNAYGNGSDRSMQFVAPQDVTITCEPGSYLVKYYLRRFPLNPEARMPESFFLGESPITIVAAR